jgi:hypothetical protein
MKLSAVLVVRSVGVALVVAGILAAQNIPSKHTTPASRTYAQTHDGSQLMRLTAQTR